MSEPAVESVEVSIIRSTDDAFSFAILDERTGRPINVSGWGARARFRRNAQSSVAFERSTVDGSIINGGTSGYFTLRFRKEEQPPLGRFYADMRLITPEEVVPFRIVLNVEESNDTPAS